MCPPMLPAVATMTIQIKRGLDLPIAGKPAQCVADTVSTERVALLGADYPGLRPDLLVAEGDRVCLGQPLFGDRAMPEVKFTAPASGVGSKRVSVRPGIA